MVYKKGAFAAGQMQVVVNEGRNAKRRLATRKYHGNVEKAKLHYVIQGDGTPCLVLGAPTLCPSRFRRN
jgi:hypothetical protein